ncbi:hypothetical protein GCM10025331_86400 [Actinoplanes utahensis]|nr:hypothetical protein Aut01nite_86170 [Actinoplanes utahensis]
MGAGPADQAATRSSSAARLPSCCSTGGRCSGVDFTRLHPVALALVVAGGAAMLLTITADVVNPVRLS